MSSIFDMSYEEFLNYDFDAEVLGSGFNSLDSQNQQEGGDSQMLNFPAGDFVTFNDEALDRSNDLAQPDWWTDDVASDQLPALRDAVPNPDTSLDFTHVEGYMDLPEILNQWSGATKCPWPKCSSKATFKTRSSLRTHVGNIHINPLICTHPQCSYKRPFGKQHELDRHISTAHGTIRNHKCPIDTCEASVSGFARKDKLTKHLRDEHENLKCPYNHCSAVVLDTQQESHLLKSHGSYECALGDCENGGASRFSYTKLKQHLRGSHGMTYWSTRRLSSLAMNDDKIVRSKNLLYWEMLQNCATCRELQLE